MIEEARRSSRGRSLRRVSCSTCSGSTVVACGGNAATAKCSSCHAATSRAREEARRAEAEARRALGPEIEVVPAFRSGLEGIS